MKRIESLSRMAELFQYKTIQDSFGNEYVVTAGSSLEEAPPVEDKTAFEAVENHVHIVDRVRKDEFEALIDVAHVLGPAVLRNLQMSYPEKKFFVFVSLCLGDSMIIRFHQQWEDEVPYYDTSSFSVGTDRVFGFSN